jgi:hypothetical protein
MIKPPGSLPGMSNLAIAPTKNPIIMAHMKCISSSYRKIKMNWLLYGSHVSWLRRLCAMVLPSRNQKACHAKKSGPENAFATEKTNEHQKAYADRGTSLVHA